MIPIFVCLCLFYLSFLYLYSRFGCSKKSVSACVEVLLPLPEALVNFSFLFSFCFVLFFPLSLFFFFSLSLIIQRIHCAVKAGILHRTSACSLSLSLSLRFKERRQIVRS